MNKGEIRNRLERNDSKGLWIDPLLDEDQIGDLTIDLRLGYDFLVSIVTRNPSIETIPNEDGNCSISSFFQPTRRQIGESFILYPNQIVLAITLEYVSLPNDICAELYTRSSYTKLGINFSKMIEPGFRGSFPVELLNPGNNPIELVVGARMFQVSLRELNEDVGYGGFKRKYFGLVRPEPSRVSEDWDLEILKKIS